MASSEYILTEEGGSTQKGDLSQSTLRILCLNIAHGRGSKAHQVLLRRTEIERNLKDISELVKSEQPSVISLQEADVESAWNGGFSQSCFIAEQAGYAYVLEGLHMCKMRLKYGTSLLSRARIHEPQSSFLKSGALLPPKGYVIGSVHFAGRLLDIVSLHLDFARARTRNVQVEQVIHAIQSRGRPVIVAGDFNCQWSDNASALRAMSEKLGLQPFQPEASSQNTFVHRPKRWDWILISEGLEFAGYRVIPTRVSDHLAVVADVRWS